MTHPIARPSSPAKARPSAQMVAPVLIQVPALSARGRPSARPAASRGRRRIRREIRVAASTMLFALPMSWAILCFAKVGPVANSDQPEAAAVVAEARQPLEEGPRVTITLEPSAVAGPIDSEVPMALPAGYLVPDDGSRESAHAGN